MYEFLDGSSDGNASQVLQAANSHWGCNKRKAMSKYGENPFPKYSQEKVVFAQVKSGHLNSPLWLQNQLYSTPVNSDQLDCNFPTKI